MTASKLLTAVSIALLAAAGAAHAETYNGVHPLTHSASRAEAVAAAHSDNPYAEGYNSGAVSVANSGVDRNVVRAAARAAARGDQLPL